MTTREALREMAGAYQHRFTRSEEYWKCRQTLEWSLIEGGWHAAKIAAAVDDAIIHGLCPEVAAILRR